MAKVKSATKSGKAISDKVLESIFSYCSSVGNFSWYQNAIAYNEALTAKQSAEETYKLYQETSKTEKRELAKQKFDNVVAEYDNKIGLIDNGIKDIDNQLDIIEAKGQMANASYYEQQKVINADKLAQYKEEKTRLESLLPNIEQGTQEWYDAKEQIHECADAISECEKTTYDLNNAIRELEVEKFEKIADQISRVSTEQEFLANLMSHEQMYDDNGSFTEYGLATLGTYSSSYYASLAKANRDKAELEKLQNQLATGNLGTFNSVEQLQDRIDELYGIWQDYISKAYSAQESIFDMMSDKFNAELDALQKLVDYRKEALNLEKSLYDYQNKIAEKTKSITTIQKQIAAYRGDTSEEGRAKLQKLQVELQDAQKDLKDTEYDKYISDQQDMLDKLLKEFEEGIKKQLKDFKDTVEKGLKTANENTQSIITILNRVSDENGYKMQYSANAQTSLQGYINQIIAAIPSSSSTDNTDNTDTNPPPANNPNTNPPATTNSNQVYTTDNTGTNTNDLLAQARTEAIKQEKKEIKKQVEKIFANDKYYKKATKKKASDYSSTINQFLFKKKGKVLTSDALKKLKEILGVSKTNDILGALKDISKVAGDIKHVKGFATGGIARLIKSKGEDGLAMVRNGEGLIAPENVPQIQELIKTVPIMNDMLKPLVDIPKMPEFTPVNRGIGDVNISFGDLNLPDITDSAQFANSVENVIRDAICKNGKTTKCITEAVSANQLGKSGVGNALRYR